MCRAKSHLHVFCSGYGGRGALDSIPARQLSAGYSARTGYWCVQVTVFFYVRQLCVRAVEYRQLIVYSSHVYKCMCLHVPFLVFHAARRLPHWAAAPSVHVRNETRSGFRPNWDGRSVTMGSAGRCMKPRKWRHDDVNCTELECRVVNFPMYSLGVSF